MPFAPRISVVSGLILNNIPYESENYLILCNQLTSNSSKA